jgi:hypothetical protein
MPRDKYTSNTISIIPRPDYGPMIEVTWLIPLPWTGRINDFYDQLLNTPAGVENVMVGRYSAWVEVASHIATVQEVAFEIYALLNELETRAMLDEVFPQGWSVQGFAGAGDGRPKPASRVLRIDP